MNQTLFEISQQQAELEAMLAENGGEITPEIEELLAINGENFDHKVRDYRNAILRIKSEIEMAKAEKERISKFIDQKNNAIEAMKERLKSAMLQFGENNIEIDGGVGGKLSFRKSDKVVIDDEGWFYDNESDPNVAACVVTKKSVSLTEAKRMLSEEMSIPAHIETNLSLQVK